LDPTYFGPTELDVYVWWWKSYFYLRYKKDVALQGVTKMFNHLSVVDISGPLFLPLVHSKLSTSTLVVNNSEDHHFLHKPILMSLLNYDHEAMLQILRTYDMQQISQECGREFGDSVTFNGFTQHG
jgi:hypothetical protein